LRDYLIRLSWPHRALSPNARIDRRAQTAPRKAARAEGWAEAKRVGAVIAADAHIEVTFYPPDRKRRDLDNLLASIKPHLDGIAQAAKVDDAGWSFTIRKREPVKGGAVLVHVKASGDDVALVPVVGVVS
jgi:crossover junction endodeoxyribonuclease RusA